MTLYLLVVTQDGQDSYSLWKTVSSARSEMMYLARSEKLSLGCMDIIPVEAHD